MKLRGSGKLAGSGLELGDSEGFVGFDISLAAEPIEHGGVEAVEWDAVAGFEEAVGDGEGVIEEGVIGEVAHGEVVDPGDGAGVAHALGVDALNKDAPEEHDFNLIGASGSGGAKMELQLF